MSGTATVRKVFTFDSAHRLPFHRGKCANLHGHTYRLEVWVQGPLDDNGFVLDFQDLKAIVKELVVDRCDHKFLNDLFPFNTTAELLARHWFTVLRPHLPGLRRLELWETPDSSAIVTADDF